MRIVERSLGGQLLSSRRKQVSFGFGSERGEKGSRLITNYQFDIIWERVLAVSKTTRSKCDSEMRFSKKVGKRGSNW